MFINQTVRRKITDDLACSFYGAVWPLIFLSQTILSPPKGHSLVFATKALVGVVFAAGYVCYRRTRQPRRLSRDAAKAAEQEVNAKMSGPKLVGLWAIAVTATVVFGGVNGSRIYHALNDAPPLPLCHRAYLVLTGNFLGLMAFWYWRALFRFTAELLRRPSTLVATIPATVASSPALAVVPAVLQPAAPPVPLAAGQGKLTP